MPNEVRDDGNPAVGARATYDAVAAAYDAAFADELDAKPPDRALLTAFAETWPARNSSATSVVALGTSRFLAQRHNEIIGVDLASAMIEVSRRQAPA